MGDPVGGGEAAEMTPASTSSAEPYPLGFGGENWVGAERAACEIIRKVQPTSVSEGRRIEVVDYIQRLIRNGLSVEVFPFGSVPLKTYLPDGDIDLTAFGGANVEDALADDIKYLLEQEEKNMASDFVVKDVQLIRAEVKLVKCIVQDIVVDLSFNQIGGLCTLCFLEQVDHLIGKDHLFKRSIILIKAWCYYESRILGAHHGLISTYALETLVLYIFQFFRSTLDGPLAVLHKFLVYFSKFDWETHCVSLNGPIRLSSLPEIVVDLPEDSDRGLLLSSDFLSSCASSFLVPSRGSDRNPRGFQLKHLNIVDPLKETNNLGRSVSKGSFYRIRSAVSYGATKLAQILLQPEDSIAVELNKFFSNTMARHGGGQWHDVQGLDPTLISKKSTSGMRISDHSYEFDEEAVSSGALQSRSVKLSQDSLKWVEGSSTDIAANREPSKHNSLGPAFHGSLSDLATVGFGGLKISSDSSNFGTPHLTESPRAIASSKTIACNGSTQVVDPNSARLENYEKNTLPRVLSGVYGERIAGTGRPDKNQLVDSAEAVASSNFKAVSWALNTSSLSVDPTHIDVEQASPDRSETSDLLSTSDLTGNYDRFLQWLHFGRWCYEYGLSMQTLTMPPPLPSTQWDGLLPPSHFEQNGFSHGPYNGLHPSPPMYVLQPVLIPGAAFRFEEVAKPRGTGTYFPHMAQPPRGYRSSSMKGRNQGSLRSPRDYGRNMIFAPHLIDRSRSNYETAQPQVPVDRSVMGCSDNHPAALSPRGNGFPEPVGSSAQSEGVVELGLIGQSSRSSMLGKSRRQRSASASSLSPRSLSDRAG
ncbi:uncharacterized protein LOC127250934 [Andrographis paniculata]|uniref:uncharacterized protein LOC127250934 n=1 Tax=Andrographis paniculata TaxID=175694 RepID=UPI0021E71C21|nr:uncharacterized protein LOC127250934 [Andrographis paniculata]XP_051130378.1 uncharacterized protein LOC127250934 [Andrographis paniculata]